MQFDGRDAAALISLDDLKLLEHLEEQLDLAAARAAMNEPGENTPYDAIRKELGVFSS